MPYLHVHAGSDQAQASPRAHAALRWVWPRCATRSSRAQAARLFLACCGLCFFERDEPLLNKATISSPCLTSCVWVHRPAERPSWQIVAASCPIGWDFVTPTPPSNLKANLAISPRPIPLMGRKDWTTLKGGGLSGSPPLDQSLMSSVHDVAWVGAASCLRRYRPRRLSVFEVSRKEAELEKASEAQLSHMGLRHRCPGRAQVRRGWRCGFSISLVPSLNMKRDPGQKSPA